MIKELKYVFFILITFFFILFTFRYYISENNKKNSYRTVNNIDKKIKLNENNLKILKNDTANIIDYAEKDLTKKKKKYFFWELMNNNDW